MKPVPESSDDNELLLEALKELEDIWAIEKTRNEPTVPFSEAFPNNKL